MPRLLRPLAPAVVFAAAVAAVPAPAEVAGPRTFASGPARVRLIELFTSEGCSSCPPAEARLAGLREHPGLWRDFVPVAFHVDYWDRLGWTDRFARPEFTARERAYARAWGADTVYTPCFVLDGADSRNRLDDRDLTAAREPAGSLRADLDADGRLRVAYTPPAGAPAADHEVHVAILGGCLTSRVRAGENRGRTLRHEFVALGLRTTRLRSGEATVSLPAAPPADGGRRALAVWIARPGHPVPVQATGGWLDGAPPAP